MKALQLLAPRRFCFVEQEPPQPGPGEVALRVRSVGVCGSDMHAYHGTQPFVRYPVILGHEVGAEVAACGPDVSGLSPGDRVVLEPMISCGRCYACRIGKYNCCANLEVMGVHRDGALRPLFIAPARNVHRAPPGMSFDEMALCETVSIGLHAVRRAEVQPGETVAVIGAGPIGLGAIQAAKAYQARVAAIDVAAGPLELARQLGADETIHSGECDVVAALMKRTAGEGAPVVIEAVGLPATIERTVDLVAPGGRIVVVGVGHSTVTFPQHIFLKKEIDFRGSRNSRNVFPELIELMTAGKIRMGPLITHRFPFVEAIAAFETIDARRREVVKAIIQID